MFSTLVRGDTIEVNECCRAICFNILQLDAALSSARDQANAVRAQLPKPQKLLKDKEMKEKMILESPDRGANKDGAGDKEGGAKTSSGKEMKSGKDMKEPKADKVGLELFVDLHFARALGVLAVATTTSYYQFVNMIYTMFFSYSFQMAEDRNYLARCMQEKKRDPCAEAERDITMNHHAGTKTIEDKK